jgi:hypothetical protein
LQKTSVCQKKKGSRRGSVPVELGRAHEVSVIQSVASWISWKQPNPDGDVEASATKEGYEG